MEKIYSNRNTQLSIFTNQKIPKKKGDYLYFIRIGDSKDRVFKIGTTNNIMIRMKQHQDYFKKDIYILWISPTYSKYTTLRIEDRQKAWWIEHQADWQYIKNDRFIIPEFVKEIAIKVIKEYKILIE